MIVHIFIEKSFVPFNNYVDELHIILLQCCLYWVHQVMSDNVGLIKNVMGGCLVSIDP